MLDTFRPLRLGSGLPAIEDAEYPWSWANNDTYRSAR
jgi:hypothetical protein